MAKKKIGVTIEEGLHQRVKSAAPLRGKNVESAYTDALTAWLDGFVEGAASGVSGGNLTDEETTLADAFIRLVRSEDPMSAPVLAGVRRWLKDNPAIIATKKRRKAS